MTNTRELFFAEIEVEESRLKYVSVVTQLEFETNVHIELLRN